ncbi:hypothetical protein FACS1894137_06280 [Spirochaetia bacterium]|nr:hypothetical protein FACS1894137_06280 [Spirochaetia bacterium]
MITCKSCNFDQNPDSAKECKMCGAELVRLCSCGFELKPHWVKCPKCKKPVTAEGAESVKDDDLDNLYFAGNLHFIKLLCLLQAIAGDTDINVLKEKLKCGADAKKDRRITLIDAAMQAVEKIRTDMLPGDDFCDAIITAEYMATPDESRTIYTSFVSRNELYDAVLGITEYAMSSNIYEGDVYRFIRQIARKWKIKKEVFSQMAEIAEKLSKISTARNLLANSDQPYKQVMSGLSGLEEQANCIFAEYEKLKNVCSASGGKGYGIALI